MIKNRQPFRIHGLKVIHEYENVRIKRDSDGNPYVERLDGKPVYSDGYPILIGNERKDD